MLSVSFASFKKAPLKSAWTRATHFMRVKVTSVPSSEYSVDLIQIFS